ncbi:hypothetical protein [Kingella oralis]|uniref:hypothetical protein n=1 Tax=Kingella oralis TaxID=505 RepID=UPI0034E5A604
MEKNHFQAAFVWITPFHAQPSSKSRSNRSPRKCPSRVKAIITPAHGLPASRKSAWQAFQAAQLSRTRLIYVAAIFIFRLPQWSIGGLSPITHLNNTTLATNKQPENTKPLGAMPNGFLLWSD